MNLTILESTVILLAVVVTITTLFRRLNIPAIVGYILVGVLVGPHLLAWISDSQSTRDLAEYGVVFLLFTIGLEFSLSRLLAIRSIVFGMGALQVVTTIVIASILAVLSQINIAQGLLIGSIIAMSSTAIVTKQLAEQYELNTTYGTEAVGILLFQDLAVIPLLILVPSLALSTDHRSFVFNLFWSFIKGLIAIVFILSSGRFLLRPLFYQITKRYSFELLTLTVLLIALSSAWLTHQLGLSLALGAFLAGIMLGETEFRHQIEVTISPFRDVLLALFFISVGMQLDPNIVIHYWLIVLLCFIGLILYKFLLVFALCLFYKNDRITSARTALVLAQAGEFGFVLLLLADDYHLLGDPITQIILAAMLFSMFISPVLIQYNQAITRFIFGKHNTDTLFEKNNNINKSVRHITNHVILCGYGRVGQNIARILDNVAIPHIAFDLDAKRVQEAKLAGNNIFYADASHYAILESAKINKAKALVISFNNTDHTIKILEAVRAANKRIPIIIRAHDDNNTSLFYQYGATEVIPEVMETSLVFASHILVLMQLPLAKVNRLISKFRQDRYALLQGIFAGSDFINEEDEEMSEFHLHVVVLTENAYAIGKKIADFDIEQVKITRVRRMKEQVHDPRKDFVFQKDDVLVICGLLSDLEHAEKMLLEGEV